MSNGPDEPPDLLVDSRGGGILLPGSLAPVYAKLVLTAILWGGTFIAGRVLAASVAPYSAAFLRFAVATALFLPLLWRREGCLPRVTWGECWLLMLLGATGVFAYNAFFFQGLRHLGAGRAALIIATNPVAIALFAALFFREPLGLSRLGGISLSVLGAIVVVSRGDLAAVLAEGVGRGELLILGCVVSWSAYSLLGRRATATLSPLVAVAYSAALGAVGLFPFALAEGMLSAVGGYPPAAWLAIGYLGVGGTVLGFLWYYEGIRAIGAARASQFINLVPLSGVALAYLLLGESVSVAAALGAVLVLTGVWITNAAR